MVRRYGTTHVFVPTILTPALAAMGELGITRVTTHGEKAAAYMADGYARASGFEMWQFSKHTDLVKLAESLGCVGIRVEQPSELKAALDRAFAAGPPVVLDVRTDIGAMAPRAWTGAPDAPLRPGTGY